MASSASAVVLFVLIGYVSANVDVDVGVTGAAPAPTPLGSSAPANDKQAAVRKVIEMLEDLQMQVVAEGEKEAASYDKFACFCKTMTIKKTKAIKKGKDEKEQISAEIEKLIAERDELEKLIAELNEEIRKANKEMKLAEKKKR
jgi:hypothetical protein